MGHLEHGREKIRQICDALKRETLEPAQREATQVVEQARMEADRILADARHKAKKIVEEAQAEVEKHRKSFHASLLQASRQALDTIREKIEQKLFEPALTELVSKELNKEKTIAQLINVLIEAIKKEGIDTDLSAAIASNISPRTINELLTQEILQKLQEKGVVLSPIGGGVEIKLHQHHLTLDFSDKTIQELIAQYIREDFKDYIYQA